MGTKLYVGNLPETCRKIDLETVFKDYGNVVECDIVQNYAFVHYETPEEAVSAQENLNGYEFCGTNLKVEVSHSKVRQKAGMGDKGDCYKCGKTGHWSKDCPKGGRGRGRGRGGPPRRGAPYDPYDRPLYRDPYEDPYYRGRYPPPPPVDRYRPYADPYERRPPPPRSPYYRERDPYARPPPEYYGRRSPPARDPYYDPYYAAPRPRYPPPSDAARVSPPRGRVPGPY